MFKYSGNNCASHNLKVPNRHNKIYTHMYIYVFLSNSRDNVTTWDLLTRIHRHRIYFRRYTLIHNNSAILLPVTTDHVSDTYKFSPRCSARKYSVSLGHSYDCPVSHILYHCIKYSVSLYQIFCITVPLYQIFCIIWTFIRLSWCS